MTEKEALILTAQVWECLAEHPEWVKKDTPYWRQIKEMTGKCPLCQYVKDKGQGLFQTSCASCPLRNLWPENAFGERSCQYKGGLWVKWCGAETMTERAGYATEIANLCHVRLGQLAEEWLARTPKLKTAAKGEQMIIHSKELLYSPQSSADKCPERLQLDNSFCQCQMVKNHTGSHTWSGYSVRISWLSEATPLKKVT